MEKSLLKMLNVILISKPQIIALQKQGKHESLITNVSFCKHLYIHACIHKYIHAYIYAYIRAHIGEEGDKCNMGQL